MNYAYAFVALLWWLTVHYAYTKGRSDQMRRYAAVLKLEQEIKRVGFVVRREP